jgi:tRNA C32,U32 (ribose-2'-O)-methylase TrmJ
MARGGAVWLLARPVYPGNIGFAIRTAEVSGADGIYIDCDFDHAGRREATRRHARGPLHAGRLESSATVLEAARRGQARRRDRGRGRAFALADRPHGIRAAGRRRGGRGVPADLLAAADATVRIPMAGFIASYNLQAAVAAVAAERFRQQGA